MIEDGYYWTRSISEKPNIHPDWRGWGVVAVVGGQVRFMGDECLTMSAEEWFADQEWIRIYPPS